jgi:hypothetical protein
MTAVYGDLATVQAYLLVFLLYLGAALVDLMRGALRYAPAASGSLRTGLRSVSLGAGCGLAYVTEKVGFLLLVMVGSPGPPEVESILARSTAAAAGIFVVVGATWPAVGPRAASARSGVAAYVRHRQLYPLGPLCTGSSQESHWTPSSPQLLMPSEFASQASGCTGALSRSRTDGSPYARSSTQESLIGSVVRPTRGTSAGLMLTPTWRRAYCAPALTRPLKTCGRSGCTPRLEAETTSRQRSNGSPP